VRNGTLVSEDWETAAHAAMQQPEFTVELDLKLVRTPDILQAVKEQREKTRGPRVTIGFAAETQNLLENATSKLHSKGLDLIVANDVSASDAGFAVDTNRVTLLDAGGGVEPLPIMSKAQVAEHVLNRLAALLS
jgi:phosphopantothenoylcysteine decarboxylase/phosphopantothenate--cysteine ligase